MNDVSRSETHETTSTQTDQVDAYRLILEASEQIRKISEQEDATELELLRLRRENNGRELKLSEVLNNNNLSCEFIVDSRKSASI